MDVSKLGLRERLKFLARDSAIYGLAATINRASSLLTVPLLARYLSVTDFGIVDCMVLLVGVLTTCILFGQDSALARYFYDVQTEQERVQVVSQSFLLQAIAILIALPIIAFFTGSINSFISTNGKIQNVATMLVLMQVPFAVLQNFSQGLLKWTFRRRPFIIVSVGYSVFVCAGIVLLVSLDIANVTNILCVHFCGRLLFCCLGLFIIRNWITIPKSSLYIRPLIVFAVPYGVICILTVGVPAIERSTIQLVLGGLEQGYFSAAIKIGALIALPIYAFQVAWGPFSLSIHKAPDVADTYNWVLKAFAVGLFCLTLVATAFGTQLIALLAGDKYLSGATAVFAICMAMSIQAVGWITEIGIDLSKKTYLKLYSNIIAFVVTLVSIYFLTKLLGLPGVAWGTLIGVSTKTVIESTLAQRAYPIAWNYSGVITLGLLTIIMGLCSQYILWQHGPIMNCGVCLIFAACLLLFAWQMLLSKFERDQFADRLSGFIPILSKR